MTLPVTPTREQSAATDSSKIANNAMTKTTLTTTAATITVISNKVGHARRTVAFNKIPVATESSMMAKNATTKMMIPTTVANSAIPQPMHQIPNVTHRHVFTLSINQPIEPPLPLPVTQHTSLWLGALRGYPPHRG